MAGGFDGQILFAGTFDPVPQGVTDGTSVLWLALDALAGLDGGKQCVVAPGAEAALFGQWIVSHFQVFDMDGGAAHADGAGLGGVEWVVGFGWHGLFQCRGISLVLILVMASWAMT